MNEGLRATPILRPTFFTVEYNAASAVGASVGVELRRSEFSLSGLECCASLPSCLARSLRRAGVGTGVLWLEEMTTAGTPPSTTSEAMSSPASVSYSGPRAPVPSARRWPLGAGLASGRLGCDSRISAIACSSLGRRGS